MSKKNSPEKTENLFNLMTKAMVSGNPKPKVKKKKAVKKKK